MTAWTLLIIGIVAAILAQIFTDLKIKRWKRQIISSLLALLSIVAIFYSSSLFSDQNFKKKLIPFENKLNLIISQQPVGETKEKLQNLKNEYDEWFEQLRKDRKSKTISIQKAELGFTEKQLANFEKNKHIYSSFFELLKNYLDAANKKIQPKIKYEIPNITSNNFIFGEDFQEDFSAKIIFKNNLIWEFRTIGGFSEDNTRIPSLYFATYGNIKDKTLITFSEILISFDVISDEIDLDSFENPILSHLGLEKRYKLNEYNKVFKKLLCNLLEYQLIKLDYKI